MFKVTKKLANDLYLKLISYNRKLSNLLAFIINGDFFEITAIFKKTVILKNRSHSNEMQQKLKEIQLIRNP